MLATRAMSFIITKYYPPAGEDCLKVFIAFVIALIEHYFCIQRQNPLQYAH